MNMKEWILNDEWTYNRVSFINEQINKDIHEWTNLMINERY